MRRGFRANDERFVANDWSPGYIVSTTSRLKGLPSARQDPRTTAHGQRAAAYKSSLAQSSTWRRGQNIGGAAMSASGPIMSPSRPTAMSSLAKSPFNQTAASPLRARLHAQQKQPLQQSQQQVPPHQPGTHAATPATIHSTLSSQPGASANPSTSRSAQEEALRLISARGDNPFVKPLQKIVDLRHGIKKSRMQASQQRRRTRSLQFPPHLRVAEGLPESLVDAASSGNTPPMTPDPEAVHAADNGKPVYDGTLARDPSAEFTLDVDGDGDVDEDEQKHANKVGRFDNVSDLVQREALRLEEGKMVLAGVFINSHRHEMHELDPAFQEHMTSRDMLNMIVDSPDFSDWMDRLKDAAQKLAVKELDTDEIIANYLDIDGDGAIDADEMEMQHRIGRYKHITDPQKRLAARIAEGQYVYAQDFVWENRDILWKVNLRWGTMTQRQIIDELISRPNYQGVLAAYRVKAQSIRLSESRSMKSCLGGSKNYIPDKAQMVLRRHRELMHACEKKTRDYICDKVDLESIFRNLNMGYSSPSGWGSVYMQNLAMLRGGIPQPGRRAEMLREARAIAADGVEEEYVVFKGGP